MARNEPGGKLRVSPLGSFRGLLSHPHLPLSVLSLGPIRAQPVIGVVVFLHVFE